MSVPTNERKPRGDLLALQEQFRSAVEGKREDIRFRIENGKVRFAEQVRRQHRELRTHVLLYLSRSNPLAVLTAPVIYALIVPFALLDGMVLLYQRVCFPIYGIPQVRRTDYLVFDRHRLAYLNWIEKLNCLYCAYASGLLAFVTQVAARTEQHWCPIRHARPVREPHSRYSRFLDFGDAREYRARVEQVRRDFADVEQNGDPWVKPGRDDEPARPTSAAQGRSDGPPRAARGVTPASAGRDPTGHSRKGTWS